MIAIPFLKIQQWLKLFSAELLLEAKTKNV
jgi:hypothetical protein